MKTLLFILSGLFILSPMWMVNFLPAFKKADFAGKKKLLLLSGIPSAFGVGLGYIAMKFLS